MTRRTAGTFRPDLTSHAELIAALTARLNEEALYPMSDTDTCKIAIEKMFKAAFPQKAIVRLPRKMYVPFKH